MAAQLYSLKGFAIIPGEMMCLKMLILYELSIESTLKFLQMG